MTIPTPAELAEEFAARLFVRIGEANLREVIRRNEIHGKGCASHDFCDANMVMLAALQSLAPELEDELDEILNRDDLLALWEEAWAIAKASAFQEFATPVVA